MLTWNLIILLFSSNQGGLAIPCCEKVRGNQRKTSRTVHTNNTDRNNSLKSEWVPGFGRVSASLLRLVRLSAPSWFRIPGSISVSCLFSACPVIVKVLAAREAWTFGLLKWITVPWFVNIFTYKRKKKGSDTLKTNERHILFFCYIMLILTSEKFGVQNGAFMIFNISYMPPIYYFNSVTLHLILRIADSKEFIYLLNAWNVVDSQFLQGELKLLVICCGCSVNNLLLSACWALQSTILNCYEPLSV